VTGTLHEYLGAFMITSRLILHRMRNISDKSFRENQNAYFIFIFFFENRAVCEEMWKIIVEPDGPQMTIWRIRTACWVPKATDTLRICNTCCFSAATIITRTLLNVTRIRTLPCSS